MIAQRFILSARARIIGWNVLLVGIALAVSVVVTGQVLLARVDSRLATEIEHEGAKLRSHADAASDQDDVTVGDLLTAFLEENLPDRDETFFSVVDGAPDRRSPHRPPARLDLDEAVVAAAAEATTPRTLWADSDAGPAWVAIFPVRVEGSAEQGALVVVEFAARARAEAWSTIRIVALIGFGSLVVAGIAAYLIAGRVLRPIRQVRRTAEQIGENDLDSRIEVVGNDDVAQLARTFNRMLDRVQAAFGAQRDFLNDVGHELRTPLTIVRGHLELLDDDPVERAQTVALLLDEIDRMRRLVDDLTTLAQADRPDFLRSGPVELTDLVVDLIAKAAAIAPRRWHIDAVADGVVMADGQRLTQALMQLCANAVSHTADTDVIAAGVSISDEEVRLWVRDTGPGISPEDQHRIFARAQRGTTAAPGTGSGLGLAIVTAIAEAHGGRVELTSVPGFGATFTLVLPAVPARAAATAAPADPASPDPAEGSLT